MRWNGYVYVGGDITLEKNANLKRGTIDLDRFEIMKKYFIDNKTDNKANWNCFNQLDVNS